ncbi:hypothetical protein A1O3_02715 [Capronia epimyces CBS 606.96]|uniref:3-oxoacyl-[acyl-carrier protein] reductase n=1 Tax=Capronia epimyces CBS 606.96 TaxID=1182542 RepID=W9YAU3_9EURO|nr:uncharacterized protein A1O3_02715 [Capronia epimyces CBS 606.96]EXJ89648.1 hypothetical protein A1O3_02715 [Capronia epimyces CBS 606.96]
MAASSSDSLSLAGKVAIITGSGKENGIGAGIATALARHGAAVVLNHVSEATGPRAAAVAERLQAEYGVKVAVVRADVSTQDGAKSLVEQGLKVLGVDKLDILVNNAGGGPPAGALQASSEDVTAVFAANVFSALFMVQAAVPVMHRGGRVINIGSIASKLGIGPTALYGAAKAANDALTYSLAMELGRGHGVTINTVAPGPVPTEGVPPPVAEIIHANLVPLTRAELRLGTVEDIADVVLFLASEKSRWLTGQFISASGGITGN